MEAVVWHAYGSMGLGKHHLSGSYRERKRERDEEFRDLSIGRSGNENDFNAA